MDVGTLDDDQVRLFHLMIPRVRAQKIIDSMRAAGEQTPDSVKDLVYDATGDEDMADRVAAYYLLEIARKAK